MSPYASLKDKIQNKEAKICIIGLGYVGLPLAIAFSEKGYFVYGLDTNKKHIEKLNRGEQYIVDINPKKVIKLIKEKRFFPTSKDNILSDSDVVIICVPTPLRKVKCPDISYVLSAVKTIKKHLRNQLIILESTSYPATTREVVVPALKKPGMTEGEDFFVCFSPERVNPADRKFTLTKIPKIVGGLSRESTKLAELIYSKVIDKVFPVSNPEAAEMAKLMENTFRMVNIALVNEFALVCNKLGISVWEVIEAAKTKPFGFMPFYPGPGLGGHCLAGNEVVFGDKGNGIEVKTIDALMEDVAKDPLSLRKKIHQIEYLKPNSNYRMLSFDVRTRGPIFKPIEMLSRRRAQGDLFKIITNDNRNVTVTNAHPMFVLEGDNFEIKLAENLKVGDKIPFFLETGKEKPQNGRSVVIDLIASIKNSQELVNKMRVRMRAKPWSIFKNRIYEIKFEHKYYHDYVGSNYLPLKYFLYAQENKLLNIKNEDVLLCTGRGSSYNEAPASIEINHEFCRLLGYYLSEGCVTIDKSMRIRFCFNVNEREYIDDVCSILKNIGIRYSLYHSKQWKASYVKVSSNVFGFLLKDILKCGSNCYEMNIPSFMLKLDKTYKWELLKGLFRGDGGVDGRSGMRTYLKNGKTYCHFNNSIGINYFSSSKILFQQVVFLLQEFGIAPTFKKRDGLLYILGYEQVKKFHDVFLGSKLTKLNIYLSNNRKIIPNRRFETHKGFAASAVKSIERIKGGYVYSAEVEDTHTIVTSYGTIVHNCIPVDPLYLSWKAKKLGFKTKMIDLASYINRFMPNYVVNRVEALLKKNNKAMENSKVLILGVTYKKGVKDLRESPALEIIEMLQKKKASVSFYDPFIPYLKMPGINLKGVKISRNNLKNLDCVIVVTDHDNVDYDFIRKNVKLIFDSRNVYKKNFANIEKL